MDTQVFKGAMQYNLYITSVQFSGRNLYTKSFKETSQRKPIVALHTKAEFQKNNNFKKISVVKNYSCFKDSCEIKSTTKGGFKLLFLKKKKDLKNTSNATSPFSLEACPSYEFTLAILTIIYHKTKKMMYKLCALYVKGRKNCIDKKYFLKQAYAIFSLKFAYYFKSLFKIRNFQITNSFFL